ncbi:glucosyl transferase [Lentzea sp. NBRC 105346]|uniref:nucleotide disphospho-sugar-binding domain-containing protein n=1 Tax=Lentzea sp. NBRC 105346 TaxID=3032205 RepID=UPI0024A4D15A|nr:nucleotide disphospho-sugar-binding domain-containing protein [Lentzea sp. NBRC 105346]GLZ30931.1 glucosyl transferase [Lentzea sp. NBRC 105346]
MRVLFVSALGTGHVLPAIPLAWALRAAGHDVLLAAAGDALVAERAGIAVEDVLPGQNMSGVFEWIKANRPELVERLGNTAGTRDLREAVPVFARVADRMADGIVDTAIRYAPDIVVYTQLQGAGPLAAAKLGIPAVQQGFGFARTAGVNELMREHLAEAYQRHGVTGSASPAKIDVAPPSMLGGEPEGWSTRYIPYNGGIVLPDLLRRPSSRPRVAVTLGTVSPTMNGFATVRRIIDVAADVDAEFVLAVGSTDIGDLPDNVIALPWMPLNSLLRTCSAVIHHGGAGTTLTAIDAGLPQLVLPDGADRFANADAVHDRGIGVSITPSDVDEEMIDWLLRSDKPRAVAAEVRDEMHGMPTPASLVPRLVELAAS